MVPMKAPINPAMANQPPRAMYPQTGLCGLARRGSDIGWLLSTSFEFAGTAPDALEAQVHIVDGGDVDPFMYAGCRFGVGV